MRFSARTFEFQFPGPALLMGILNVTPDSFSDGGRYTDTGLSVTRAHELIEQGAHIVDIGGESTRPFAPEVSLEEELRRVLPVIEKLRDQVTVPISIDTMKPEVARLAVEAGAAIVNDVSASHFRPQMLEVVAVSGAGYVAMHMRGTPQTMQLDTDCEDIMADLDRFFQRQIEVLDQAGVHRDRVVLDVGIGFGKSLEDNLKLLAEMGRFQKWGRPLLLGASRKSFLGRLAGAGAGAGERLPGSLSCACWGVQKGVNIIRTHDVRETKQAVRLTEELLRHQDHVGDTV